MRAALVVESPLAHMNGVTHSVLQAVHHLQRTGHETLVIAPGPGADESPHRGAAALLPGVPLPGYPEVRVAFARAARVERLLRAFSPDVVHLASPFVLGWQALVAADALRLPTVAVYQTDIVAYARRYRVAEGAAIAQAHVARLHRRATLTLAPSTASLHQLERMGVDRLRRWGRGVDAVRFAPEHRDDAWRARVAGHRTIVGYVGRLAPEKQVEDLAVLADLPGIKLVVVGDGPSRAELERVLPDALFTGHLEGHALARTMACFDVFVHPGESDTFGQTLQEAMASGVPVVATGVGGPVDLVRSSVDGWLYRPGDLRDLRARVADLVGDDAKRRAFAQCARATVQERSWHAVCAQLVGHYERARALRPIDDALFVRTRVRPDPAPTPSASGAWCRYVALGDSLTEGLCDSSRMAAGEYRGWADRLARLLAHSGAPTSDDAFHYANLAVRSRRIRHLLDEQVPAALRLRPDLVSVLMGANDLVSRSVRIGALTSDIEDAVRRLRDAGCHVLLVTPFLPRRFAARLFARRFALFNAALRRIAADTGSVLLDLDAVPAIGDPQVWAGDRVHLSSAGHRLLAYRAAEALGVPDAEVLGGLDAALHDDHTRLGTWMLRDALPWLWRRARGRTAGDGLAAKHDAYIQLPDIPSLPDITRRTSPSESRSVTGER